MEIRAKKFNERKGFLLGCNRRGDYIYMKDFSWNCNWYWGGGYLTNCFKNTRCSGHYHFNDAFLLGAEAIDKVEEIFKWSTLTVDEWWRLLDLMKQFYTLRDCAMVLKSGGGYTDRGRTPEEIDTDMAYVINRQIETVVIPQVRKLLTGGL